MRLAIDTFLLFIIGTVFGSFVTMASYRLPLGKDIVAKRSSCTKCKKPLTFQDLIPMLSFLYYKGKCRQCSAEISYRYPLIELVMGLYFVFVYELHGLSVLGIIFAAIGVVLMIMIVTDLEHYIIPIELQFSLIPFLFLYRIIMAGDLNENIFDAIIGMSVGALIGYGLQVGYKKIRKKEGLGGADVIFLAIAGGFLGLERMAIFLFLAGLFGILTHILWQSLKKGKLFPFGPALAISLILCLILDLRMDISYMSKYIYGVSQ